MATGRRTRSAKKRGKLILLLLPIAIMAAILVSLFLEEGKQLLGLKTAQRTMGQSRLPKHSKTTTEEILDPERKKLDEILKNR